MNLHKHRQPVALGRSMHATLVLAPALLALFAAQAFAGPDEDAALLLEKARAVEDVASSGAGDEEGMARLIVGAREALGAFIRLHPDRPDRAEIDFEMQCLSRVLGLLRARQARFETDAARRDEFIRMARLALDDASAGCERLRGDFERRRGALKDEAEKRRRLRDAEAAKPAPDAAALQEIDTELDGLAGKIAAAEYRTIQCDYLAADCAAILGETLRKIEGGGEGDLLLDRAAGLYDKIFDAYKKTPHIEIAYMALCESVRAGAPGGAGEAARRIQAETTHFLVTRGEQIEKEALLRRILARMRLAAAETFNALGRYEEARAQADLVLRNREDLDFGDKAKIEIAKSLKGGGDIANAARTLGEVIGGPYRGDAIDILAEWADASTDIAAKFPAEIQLALAARLFAGRRYDDARRMLSDVARQASGAEDDKWAAKALLYLARCRHAQALAQKSGLEASGRAAEGMTEYLAGLEEAVSVVTERMAPKYGRSGDEARADVLQALYYALEWQNQMLLQDPRQKNLEKLENIRAQFKDLFPDSPSVPDANYLRGVRLETEGRCAEAVESYGAVSPGGNAALLARLRAALCRCRIFRGGGRTPEEFAALWREMSEAIESVARKLDEDPSPLSEVERARFASSLADGEYARALLIFSAAAEDVRLALGEGANRYQEVGRLLGDFVDRHPSSPYTGQVSFMLAHSRIMLGETEAAEADVERLRGEPELYKNSLAALRDGYYNLYLLARKSGDAGAARKYGEKYIDFALRLRSGFPGDLAPDDMLRMGEYLYGANRPREALDILSGAWKALDEGLGGAYSAPEAAARAKAALRAVGERMGEIIVLDGGAENLKQAARIYDRLIELRREALRADLEDKRGLDAAIEADPSVLHYRTRRAMAAVSLQSLAGAEMPDLDSLMAAVRTLAQAARARKQLTDEWWLAEYWLAHGLLLQRDFDSASRVVRNVFAVSGGYGDGSGAGGTAVRGKTFRELFEELNKKIEIEQH